MSESQLPLFLPNLYWQRVPQDSAKGWVSGEGQLNFRGVGNPPEVLLSGWSIRSGPKLFRAFANLRHPGQSKRLVVGFLFHPWLPSELPRLTCVLASFLQFASDLDQILPSLEKAQLPPGLCGSEAAESGGIAIKSEILTPSLQPGTAARTPTGMSCTYFCEVFLPFL